MRVFANTLRQTLPTFNVIAEKTGANDDNVVMAGAHLDSVLAGPGINDNGSGSAAILEVAEQLANVKTQNTVRFAWWGAEESGLVGSTNYVNGLSQAEKDRIALYLNFDMIGSPNYIFMTQDADQSSFTAPVVVPPGSVADRGSLRVLQHPAGRAVRRRRVRRTQRLPGVHHERHLAGGLFTGAEVPKTAEQQAIWGGTAGEQFDPCYHEACDTYADSDEHALDVNADAGGFAILTRVLDRVGQRREGQRVPGTCGSRRRRGR